jgi:hypothetical protein
MMSALAASPSLKVEVMCAGVRYSDALGAAAAHSLPNYYPYRFRPGEHDPTGKGTAAVPYLMNTPDGTMIRVLGNGDSAWHVEGNREHGYQLIDDADGQRVDIVFQPLLPWMTRQTSDGFPVVRSGVSTHGDMLVINVAPGCEFFLHKHDGESMRCTFCSYGAPDERTRHLGQFAGRVEIPDLTLRRLAESVAVVLEDTDIRHIYLVGGSLVSGSDEGKRFLQLARAVRDANPRQIPVTLGSGALPDEFIHEFRNERLVENVCFNLEIWSEPLFAAVCPGKHRYVGYDRWIAALETAVRLWGPGHVYSAMVAGVELEPEFGLDWQNAVETAIAGADDLTRRGIIPIYSLHWPTGGRERPGYHARLRGFFETLNTRYQAIREARRLSISPGFMCHSCAYMQLECDIDRSTRVAS